jgi:CheY-like chemotaxis protein
VVQKQLIKAGCVVQVANHGIEALEMIRETDIWHEQSAASKHLDVILMDWEMPIMDGLACSREIRALQKAGKITRHVEIIATTANARDEQIATALASGCVCTISPTIYPLANEVLGLCRVETIHGKRFVSENSRTSQPKHRSIQRSQVAIRALNIEALSYHVSYKRAIAQPISIRAILCI